MKFFSNLLLLVGCCSVLVSQYVNAQCIETVNCPPALVPCNAGAQTITAATNPPSLANSLQWTGSGVSGSGPSVTFTPNCGLLGVKQITPYLPAGTAIPTQSRNIPAFSGNIPYTTTFSLDNICYGPGIVYEGLITGNVSGANDDVVNICVNSPSLDTCLNNLPVSIVNGQLANGLDIGLLLNGAGVDP
ncbi:MAG TPA: hypothetical protein PK230_14490, partial [Chitinophagales bacterium]|nr:hypothetical protein [Chitinophagales bacterium]